MTQEPEQEIPAVVERFSYPAKPDLFDEMQEAGGQPRRGWRQLLRSLERLGAEELGLRTQTTRRLLREHGVTYTNYGDPKGTDRPWGLDLVPLIITPGEWTALEAGLIQRARLFNMILSDIYGGSQRLLRDGFIPPELVYANPAFLRPCRGLHVSSGIYLQLHACDLGRSPDGQWWVLRDRTQAPGGAGYAWENRNVLSRVLPQQIRDCNVQPVGSFFRQLREILFGLAPLASQHPSVVLLTPGPQAEIYFEHAYLARHLDFPLVEGADLTVRHRRVFLKTVEGLEPVDVILRRVDDRMCDPLELRGDSLLGVPGLVDAARSGQVTIANALGAGLMESPAFLPFLPELCRRLLGEDLLLPSVPTWWCGQAEALRTVTKRLDSLQVKSALGNVEPNSASSARASATPANLVQEIEAAPHRFVAQERVQLSVTPCWIEDRLVPRSVIVRAFIAQGANSAAVLPGGLTRVSDLCEEPVLSVQGGGGGSKDIWILSDGATQRLDMGAAVVEARPAERVMRGVPSRAADHLFWLGRYTERLEQLLRILRCILGRLSSEPAEQEATDQRALVQLARELGLWPTPPSADQSRDPAERVLKLLYAPEAAGGARELVRQIRATASAVRDRFSGDTWRILGRLDHDGEALPGRVTLADATALTHDLVLDLAAFNGMEMENMTRGRAWRFLDLGRRLERGLSMVKLLHAAGHISAQPAAVLGPVLEIADSVMTYRRLFFDRPSWPGVLAILIRDDSNPRSLAFQVHVIEEHMAALGAGGAPIAREFQQAHLSALVKDIAVLEYPGPAMQPPSPAVLELLNKWAEDLAAVSDQVSNRYFSHSAPRIS
jgi:uncharacterized circularly permuted ATP-grasp superfamily protein/uncharacterized alpha-E superfamily protein